MYRCFGCDNPAQMGHHKECIVAEPASSSNFQWYPVLDCPLEAECTSPDCECHKEKINIASGEDVMLV